MLRKTLWHNLLQFTTGVAAGSLDIAGAGDSGPSPEVIRFTTRALK
ncbi:hypothetical protein I553_3564 [Mycobacterium xenopi 4042]|uniref:Uncharacterized protein n=1 Tax=Mycobacterium xenopi 4042 TaxID=1299334 RepID=X8AW79_MYCXE|nr:hypothetical protein I553_3564 [Mycobacterium xenopi 4042]